MDTRQWVRLEEASQNEMCNSTVDTLEYEVIPLHCVRLREKRVDILNI